MESGSYKDRKNSVETLHVHQKIIDLALLTLVHVFGVVAVPGEMKAFQSHSLM